MMTHAPFLAHVQLSAELHVEVKMGKAKKKSKSFHPNCQENEKEEEIDDNLCFLCLEPGVEKCSHCGLISVCSKDHLKLHRPENLCFPFKIRKNDSVGRFMVATRDIQPLGNYYIYSYMCTGGGRET